MNFTKSTLFISLLFSGTIFGMDNLEGHQPITQPSSAESRANNLLNDTVTILLSMSDDSDSDDQDAREVVVGVITHLEKVTEAPATNSLLNLSNTSSPRSRSSSNASSDSPRRIPRTTCLENVAASVSQGSSDSVSSSPYNSDGNIIPSPHLTAKIMQLAENPHSVHSETTSPLYSPTRYPFNKAPIGAERKYCISLPSSLNSTPRKSAAITIDSPTGSSSSLVGPTRPIHTSKEGSPDGSAESLTRQSSLDTLDEEKVFTKNLSDLLCEAMQRAQQEGDDIIIATENVDHPDILRTLSTATGNRLLIISQHTTITAPITDLMRNGVVAYRARYPITGITAIFSNFALVSPTYVPKKATSSPTDQLKLLVHENEIEPHFQNICATITNAEQLTLPAVQSSSSALQEKP